MFHTCDQRFDVTGNLENFYELNKLQVILAHSRDVKCMVLKVKNLALFSSKKFCKTDTVVLSFVFDKYCPIMD